MCSFVASDMEVTMLRFLLLLLLSVCPWCVLAIMLVRAVMILLK